MSSGTQSPAPSKPTKKPDLVTAPMTAVLAACVVAALGYSKGSELLTWQVPVAVVALAVAWTAFRVMRTRG